MELVAECVDVGRDEPQVFDDEWEGAQFAPYRAEEVSARTRHPSAGLGRRRLGWDVPGGRERTEMIQANHIHVSQQGSHAVYPPTIAGPTKGVPIIDRIAPQLPLGAERVRRHTRDDKRPTLFVQQ